MQWNHLLHVILGQLLICIQLQLHLLNPIKLYHVNQFFSFYCCHLNCNLIYFLHFIYFYHFNYNFIYFKAFHFFFFFFFFFFFSTCDCVTMVLVLYLLLFVYVLFLVVLVLIAIMWCLFFVGRVLCILHLSIFVSIGFSVSVSTQD